MNNANKVLKSVFGYDDFRGPQADIISNVMENRNTMVLMPTGGGKSLCYQIPAILKKGTTIVISPLLALMRDQVSALRQAGVSAAQISSAVSYNEIRNTENAVLSGKMDLLYVAPERFTSEGFIEFLKKANISLFAIDEAHCVSQWGHDFRPDYLEVGRICAQFDVPRIALTATADEITRRDMADRLFMKDADVFISSYDRANLTYIVTEKDEPKKQLLKFLSEHKNKSGIVYCLSRTKVDETALFLRSKGYNALPYHAGMDQRDKEGNQDKFIQSDNTIMVATIAFGMGIDKPDVRFVAHIDLPSSLESYYQETGRAGRDGLPSTVWMTYGLQDVVQRRKMIEGNDGTADFKLLSSRKLNSLIGYCESPECRRAVVLRYFGEAHAGNCGNCDRCLQPVATYDGTTDARKLLSAVKRTGERFGGAHLIDILIGNKTDKVKSFNHDNLPTFGIGVDKITREWNGVIRQSVAAGLLESPADRYGGLSITPKGLNVLKGLESIRFTETRKESKIVKAHVEVKDLFDEGDTELRDKLKDWRYRTARSQGIPSYVVFPDRTLNDLVRIKPVTEKEMSSVYGMGLNRVKRYFEDVSNILHNRTNDFKP